jgi:hypothetical protein
MSRSTVLKLVAVGTVVYFIVMYWLSVTYDPTKRRYSMHGVPNSQRLLPPFIPLPDSKIAFRGYAFYFRGENTEHSRMLLYEDGRLLGSSDSPYPEIANIGMGRFSYTNYQFPFFMFTASDNSDPNTNGRTYWAVRQNVE